MQHWTLWTLDTLSSALSMDTAHNKDKEEEVVKVGREFEFGYFRLTNASYFMYQKVARYISTQMFACRARLVWRMMVTSARRT